MKKAFKIVGFMFVMILLTKVLGQVREIIIGSIYGTGDLAAAFNIASVLPLNLFDIVFASAVVSAFIPVYNTYLEKDGEEESDRFASAFLNLVFLGSFILCGILILFASPLVSLMSMSDEITDEIRYIAQNLTIIVMPVMIFASLTFSFVGILQSKGEFNIPAIMSLVLNVVMIVYLLFFNKIFGITGLAVSLLIGWILQFLLQLPFAAKLGFKYHFIFKHPGIPKVLALSLPVMVGTWLQPITAIVNTAFASGFPALNYANRLYIIISSVFTASITNYIFPRLSKQSVTDDVENYKHTLKTSFKIIILFLIPLTATLLALSNPIIDVVYSWGNFDADSLYYTSNIFFYYSLGILFFGLIDLFNKAFYARKNTIVPSVTSVLAIGVTVVCSLILKNYMGVFGLALSSSISAIFASTVLFIFLNKELKFVDFSDFIDVIFSLLCGILTFVIITLLYKIIPLENTKINLIIKIVVSAGVGALSYGGLIYLLSKDVRRMVKNIIC